MDQLILYVNKLQEVCAAVGEDQFELDLPQIVVVGSQSSGKTSVLESFVGKDFLPRGQNIVTRRPLVLQLVHIDDNTLEQSTGAGEWAIFGHKPQKIFTNFEHVKAEIVAETDRLTGSTRDISPEPIFLKIYSPFVVTLTLVDLPGLVTVSVDGQPADIGKRIKDLVKSYISKPNTIILAVSAATTDLATSHALEMSKKADPTGDRTIAVLTKLDAVEKAHQKNILEVLQGKILKVKLGIIGVVNRSQEDILANKSIEAKRAEEKKVLQMCYPEACDKNGTTYLANRLSKLLAQHILKWIPHLQTQINEAVVQNKAIVEQCSLPEKSTDKSQIMFAAVEKFCNSLHDSVEGYAKASNVDELVGGARIYQIYFASYPAQLDQVAEPLLADTSIATAVKNAIAVRPHLFTPHRAFENLARTYLEEIRTPSLTVAEDVKRELDMIVEKSCQQMMATSQLYPNFMHRLVEETGQFLQVQLGEAKKMVDGYVDAERSYININHPDFDSFFQEALHGPAKPVNKEYDNEDKEEEQLSRTTRPAPPAPTQNYIENSRMGQDSDLDSPKMGRKRDDRLWKTLMPKNKKREMNSFDYGTPPNATNGFPTSNSREDLQANSSWFIAQQQQQQQQQQPQHLQQHQQQQHQQHQQYQQEHEEQPRKVRPPMQNASTRESTNVQNIRGNNIEVIAASLRAYTRIVRRTAVDLVPKVVMLNLVDKATECLARHLHSKFYSNETLEELLAESPDVAEKRIHAERMLEAYDEASQVLFEIRSAYCIEGFD